jgi:PAS domain S-box-containing protein
MNGPASGLSLGGGSRYFRALMDSLLDAVVIADERDVIWGYNQAAHRLFGYAPAEVLGRPVGLLMPTTCWRADTALDARYAAGASAVASRRRIDGCRKDGSGYQCDLDLTLFVVDGRRFVVGVARETGHAAACGPEPLPIGAAADAAPGP